MFSKLSFNLDYNSFKQKQIQINSSSHILKVNTIKSKLVNKRKNKMENISISLVPKEGEKMIRIVDLQIAKMASLSKI